MREYHIKDLTLRQKQVIDLVAKGWRNKEIGDDLGIKVETVKMHIMRLMFKFGARNRTHLAIMKVQHDFENRSEKDGE